jgi:hypothetical protein
MPHANLQDTVGLGFLDEKFIIRDENSGGSLQVAGITLAGRDIQEFTKTVFQKEVLHPI